MKSVVLITGSTGSGKSTLAASLGGSYHMVNTGAFVRNYLKKTNACVESENPVAPPEMDEIIKDYVFGEIERNDLVVVECAPRNLLQLEWIREMRELGWAVSVVRCVCSLDVRKSRIRVRDAINPRRYELDCSKIKLEGDDYDHGSYFGTLLKDVEHTVVDTTSTGVGDCAEESMDVGDVYTMAKNVLSLKTDKCKSLEHFAGRMIDEISEAVGASDREHKIEELVDVMFFLMVSFYSVGAESKDIKSMILKKYNVNCYRDNTGMRPHACME